MQAIMLLIRVGQFMLWSAKTRANVMSDPNEAPQLLGSSGEDAMEEDKPKDSPKETFKNNSKNNDINMAASGSGDGAPRKRRSFMLRLAKTLLT
jgi:hypothetical protein